MVAHTILFWLASQGAAASTVATATETGKTESWRAWVSNLAGSLSILCWFIVFTPQLWTNYKRKSGESLSLVFLYIWLSGDVMNLIGTTMNDLLLTMRLLAWYYIFADLVMIWQVYYYRRTSVKGSFESVIAHASPEVLNEHQHHGEHAPLVNGISAANYSSIAPSKHVHDNEHDRVIHKAAMAANAAAANYSGGADASYTHSGERPAYRQRRPSANSATSSIRHRSTMAKRRKMIKKAAVIGFTLMIIALCIFLYYDWAHCDNDGDENDGCRRDHGGHGRFPPSRPPRDTNDVLAIMGGKKEHKEEKPTWIKVLPTLMGWGSASLYLGSRIPQIYKNWRLKSCEGLSLTMFVFSVLGNVLYVASIFLFSLELDYLITNMPYWIGSGGTLIFDFTIFFQFYLYRSNAPLNEAFQEAAATGELNDSALEAAAADAESIEDGQDSDSSSQSSYQQDNNPADKKKRKAQQQAGSAISTNV